MIKYTYTFILISILGTLHGFSQQKDFHFIKPEKLPEHINSPSEEIYPLTYKRDLYFVRAFSEENTGGKISGHDIWISTKSDIGDWQKPTNDLGGINNEGSNAIVGIGEEGKKFYLMNIYDTDSSVAGISSAKMTDSLSFYDPDSIPVAGLDPQTRLYGVYVDPNEEVMIVSMNQDNSLGKEDLYIFLKDENNVWDEPVHLKDISSAGFDMSPFLGPDRKTLYFSSNRSGGYGKADIYVTTRKGDSWTEWTKPKNIGNVVNSKHFDAYFSIFSDSTAYFVSDRENSETDIYETELVEKADKKGNITYHFGEDNYVFFDFDEHVLKPSMRNFLKDVIKKLNAKPDIRSIVLRGHADYIGPDEYNKKLGKKRAKTVKDFLKSRGVPESKIETISYGENRPAIPGKIDGKDLPKHRALNRRVKIDIVEEKDDQ